MNYKELFNKYDDTKRHYHFGSPKFHKATHLANAQKVIDADLELSKLGDDLEFCDYPMVRELVLKREGALEHFLVMSMSESPATRRRTPQERIEFERGLPSLVEMAIGGQIDF